MKSYFINLDRGEERRKWMERQLAAQGFPFERVDAVDCLALSREELDSHQRRRKNARALADGEIAVGYSHRKCWQLVVDGQDDYACVMEDDIHLSQDAKSFLSSADWIPTDADVVKLESFNRYVLYDKAAAGVFSGRRIVPLHYRHYGAAGYIVSRDGARKLLELTESFNDIIDIVIFDPDIGIASKLNIYQVIPALCMQNDLLPEGNRIPELASSVEKERRSVPSRGRSVQSGKPSHSNPLTRLRKSVKKRYHRYFTTKVYDRIPFGS